ncbi:MAG: heme exporter protein CcmD [Acidobacteria bacterium]|nr:MAG: heme exporter protein CcmD [Acidobacteriota bacterium]PYR52491.1 MAG: heme exporter protein CcmD [Acidobacteriota bacterium]
MGHDGVYVWTAYALTLAAMAVEVAVLLWRSRSGRVDVVPGRDLKRER